MGCADLVVPEDVKHPASVSANRRHERRRDAQVGAHDRDIERGAADTFRYFDHLVIIRMGDGACLYLHFDIDASKDGKSGVHGNHLILV